VICVWIVIKMKHSIFLMVLTNTTSTSCSSSEYRVQCVLQCKQHGAPNGHGRQNFSLGVLKVLRVCAMSVGVGGICPFNEASL
jgi:hypothetical protein